MLHDLRHAVRLLVHQPGTTAVVVLTLSFAIGANTAVFSAVHAALIRQLPYAEPDQLVLVWEKRPGESRMDGPVSPADFLDWVRMSESFSALAAYTPSTADLTGVGEPVQLPMAEVSASYFDVFRVRALHGRTFARGEDTPGRHRVVVLGHSLWQQRFGAEPSVVGQSTTLNGEAWQIVGVLPPGLELPGEPADLWAPLALEGPVPPPRASHYLTVYGRLRADVPLEQGRREMDRVGRQLEATYPGQNRGHGAHVVPLHDDLVRPVRGALVAVLAAVGFVLLIACVNVASVLLARATGRRREMAIRSAVGAARGRLVRQLLTESLVLAVLCGAAGLLVGWWGIELVSRGMPLALRTAGLDKAALNLPVLAFTGASGLLASTLAGLLPAWQLAREDSGPSLRDGGRSASVMRRSVRFGLIAAEVAMTSMLLVGAGLTLRSFARVLDEDPGLELVDRLTVSVTLPAARYADDDARRRAFARIEEQMAGVPGIRSVGGIDILPFTGDDSRRGIDIEGRESAAGDPPTRAHPRVVTPAYLETAGVRIVSGRGFRPQDGERAPLVVIVNETMARRYWPGRPAIGRRVAFPDDSWREVVGVAADVKHWGLDRDVNPMMYLPQAQLPSASLTFVLHGVAREPLALVASVRERIQAVDPHLPLAQVRTMEEVAARTLVSRRWTVVLLGAFAVLALVLAAAGMYGVMAHVVSLRTVEIGIRLSLGARPVDVVHAVLGEGIAQAAVGLGVGLSASIALMGGIRTLLFGVEPADPPTLAAVAGLLLVVAVLACAIPAHRAMRVNPVEALRQG